MINFDSSKICKLSLIDYWEIFKLNSFLELKTKKKQKEMKLIKIIKMVENKMIKIMQKLRKNLVIDLIHLDASKLDTKEAEEIHPN